jgi:hypothetical protein
MHAPDPTAAERYHRIDQLCAQLRQLVSSSAEQRGTLDRLLEEALRVADEIQRELRGRAYAVEQRWVKTAATEHRRGAAGPLSIREQPINSGLLGPFHDTDRNRADSGADAARRDMSAVVDARPTVPLK